MGFRCLKDFNVAMLAKQGWQLLKYPASLLGQLLKAKYFPQTSFLKADIGTMSYTWRSIIHSQPLLAAGIRWRVGCGESIRIVDDKWIPRPTTFQIIASPSNLSDDSNVSLLIDRDRRCWNEELIRSNFLPLDAEVIRQIPLSPDFPRDMLLWHHTKHGAFSVCLAYYLCRNIISAAHSTESSVGRSCWGRKFGSLIYQIKLRCLHGRRVMIFYR